MSGTTRPLAANQRRLGELAENQEAWNDEIAGLIPSVSHIAYAIISNVYIMIRCAKYQLLIA